MANEKRLIDSDVLMEAAYDSDEKQGNDVWHTGDIEYLVMAQPTVDAVEVVHGRWETEMDDMGWLKHTCPICGYVKRTDIHVRLGWNYCPNCGAKMDGERKDNG